MSLTDEKISFTLSIATQGLFNEICRRQEQIDDAKGKNESIIIKGAYATPDDSSLETKISIVIEDYEKEVGILRENHNQLMQVLTNLSSMNL